MGNGWISGLSIDANGVPQVINTVKDDTFTRWENGLAITPDGKYLYATDDWLNVFAYAIDQTTGALTLIEKHTGVGLNTYGITATNKYVYVTDERNGNVTRLTINADGSLSGGSVAVDISGATTPKVDPSGQYVFVSTSAENKLYGYRINQTNGALTSVGTANLNGTCNGADAIAFSVDARFMYVNSWDCGVHALSFDLSTGAAVELSTSPYTKDSSNGDISADGSVVVDPSNNFVYVATASRVGVLAFRRDTSDGTLTPIGVMPTQAQYPTGMAVTF
jgi:6-phosphogluconolactonase (cycloisomerase 2 family)